MVQIEVTIEHWPNHLAETTPPFFTPTRDRGMPRSILATAATSPVVMKIAKDTPFEAERWLSRSRVGLDREAETAPYEQQIVKSLNF